MQGDLDGNNIVDWDDLRMLLDWWITGCRIGQWCDGRDLDKDGNVAPNDFVILASEWLQSCP